MKLSNAVYDVLKWIAQYLLPGLGTFYFAVAKIWDLPYGAEIVGTISAIDTLLAMLLGLSSHSYEGDGTLVVDTTDPTKDNFRYIVSTPLDELANAKRITLKVEKKE